MILSKTANKFEKNDYRVADANDLTQGVWGCTKDSLQRAESFKEGAGKWANVFLRNRKRKK
jgi:hypothetical protein